MTATKVVKSFPTKKFMIMLLFMTTMGPTMGSTQQPHVERPEHDQTQTRQRHHNRKIEKVFWDLIEKWQNDKNQCKDGEFLSLLGSGACESCDRFCGSSTTDATCELECKVYNMQKKIGALVKNDIKQSEKIQQLQKTEKKEEDGVPTWALLIIMAFVLVLIITAVTMLFWGKSRVMQKTIDELKNRIEGIQREQRERNEDRILNGRKCQIIQPEINHTTPNPSPSFERRIQQATPDTTPDTTPNTSPTSTMSRQTSSTAVEEMVAGNGDGVAKAELGMVTEPPGGKF